MTRLAENAIAATSTDHDRRGVWPLLGGKARVFGPRSSYASAAFAVMAATGLMVTMRDALGVLNVALLFLLLSFAVALLAGSGPAALAAVLSFLAFDFFFIEPYYRFAVQRSHHLLTLFAFLGIAIVTGQLVARVRARTHVAEREVQRTALLYELNAALIGDVTLDSILATVVERVVRVYGAAHCRIILPDGDGALAVRARFPPAIEPDLDRQRLAIARWVIEHRSPAGQGGAGRRVHLPHRRAERPATPPRQDGPDALLVPIATAERVVGALEIGGRPDGGRFREEDERLLTSFANQAALALERARLTDEAARAGILAQSDELKSALLAAVSHDLRTPLAAIKASVTSLLDPSVAWEEAARSEFLQAIDEETDRLSRMVGNLLDLSRIEGGALRPEKEWYDIAELVADVVNRLSGLAARHRLATDVAPNLPLVHFDYVEIAQVLMNLGENTVKHTPPGTTLTLSAHQVAGAIELAIKDDGPGIAPHRLPHIFEKFYRVDRSGRTAGTGIGLAISKGLVEAHGGRIWAASDEGRGTTVRFTLPLGPASETRA